MTDQEVLNHIAQTYRVKGRPPAHGDLAAWFGRELSSEEHAQAVRVLETNYTVYRDQWYDRRSLAKKLTKQGVPVEVVSVPNNTTATPVVLEIAETQGNSPVSRFKRCMDEALSLADELPRYYLREAALDVDLLAGALEARFIDEHDEEEDDPDTLH